MANCPLALPPADSYDDAIDIEGAGKRLKFTTSSKATALPLASGSPLRARAESPRPRHRRHRLIGFASHARAATSMPQRRAQPICSACFRRWPERGGEQGYKFTLARAGCELKRSSILHDDANRRALREGDVCEERL
jgi:hypothetical protein